MVAVLVPAIAVADASNPNPGTIFSITPSGLERVVVSFGAPGGGETPNDLLGYRGALYGTTQGGGTVIDGNGAGQGTFFLLDPHGALHTLFNFGKPPGSGTGPQGGLAELNGTFYGTTIDGASGDGGVAGVIYAMSPSGDLHVVHRFKDNDGTPVGRLIAVGGALYGVTTSQVYRVTTDGTFRTLHVFGGGTDASGPSSGLTELNGKLYGATSYGGAYVLWNSGGGTVYSVAPNGTERVLHNFGDGADGLAPASLRAIGNALYGTTDGGGSISCSGGTAFRITPDGTERVLHSFGGRSDGARPKGEFAIVGDTIYGVTAAGGIHNDAGTVYSMTLAGKERVLHTFGFGKDGSMPIGLTEMNGLFYGSTNGGGSYASPEPPTEPGRDQTPCKPIQTLTRTTTLRGASATVSTLSDDAAAFYLNGAKVTYAAGGLSAGATVPTNGIAPRLDGFALMDVKGLDYPALMLHGAFCGRDCTDYSYFYTLRPHSSTLVEVPLYEIGDDTPDAKKQPCFTVHDSQRVHFGDLVDYTAIVLSGGEALIVRAATTLLDGVSLRVESDGSRTWLAPCR